MWVYANMHTLMECVYMFPPHLFTEIAQNPWHPSLNKHTYYSNFCFQTHSLLKKTKNSHSKGISQNWDKKKKIYIYMMRAWNIFLRNKVLK